MCAGFWHLVADWPGKTLKSQAIHDKEREKRRKINNKKMAQNEEVTKVSRIPLVHQLFFLPVPQRGDGPLLTFPCKVMINQE